MKKIISLAIAAIMLLTSAFTLASCNSENLYAPYGKQIAEYKAPTGKSETLTVALSPDFAPMEFVYIDGSNQEIVGFDVADEIVPLFDKETIRQSNIENPQKQVKSIKAAMGGYTAGEQYSANLMKNYFDKIKSAGMQVWVLGHSKYKNIKDKANVDNEGYMQLSSNLSAAYEAALGDIFDVVLTGIIDRNIETVGEGDNAKRYATDAIRKLYFRGTPEIDAGGRFAAEAVPEYMIFDKPNMAADFIKIIEEGMEKSKTTFDVKKSVPKAKPVAAPAPVVEEVDDLDEEDNTPPFDVDVDEVEVDIESIKTEIRNLHKKATPEQKAQIKELRAGIKLDDIEDIELLTAMLEVFE